jgi:hypothetical protein
MPQINWYQFQYSLLIRLLKKKQFILQWMLYSPNILAFFIIYLPYLSSPAILIFVHIEHEHFTAHISVFSAYELYILVSPVWIKLVLI